MSSFCPVEGCFPGSSFEPVEERKRSSEIKLWRGSHNLEVKSQNVWAESHDYEINSCIMKCMRLKLYDKSHNYGRKQSQYLFCFFNFIIVHRSAKDDVLCIYKSKYSNVLSSVKGIWDSAAMEALKAG